MCGVSTRVICTTGNAIIDRVTMEAKYSLLLCLQYLTTMPWVLPLSATGDCVTYNSNILVILVTLAIFSNIANI